MQESLQQAADKDPSHFEVATRPFTFGADQVIDKLCSGWGIKNIPWGLPSREGAPDLQEIEQYNARVPQRQTSNEASGKQPQSRYAPY